MRYLPSLDSEASFNFNVWNFWSCAKSFAKTMHVLSDKLCDDRLNTFPLSSVDEDILKNILFFKNLFDSF
jgi:hypothetical protein